MAPADKSTLASKYATLPAGVPDWLAHSKDGDLTFGKPFSFGSRIEFTRKAPEYLEGSQWHPLSYLDPARLWLPTQPLAGETQRQQQQRSQAVKATVVSETRTGGLENVPPPAQVTISKGLKQPPSGLWASQASGVAVREYGRVVPLGSDGSYMVYERLDYAETKRRAPDAAAAMKRLKSLARGQTWREQGDEEGQVTSAGAEATTTTTSGPAYTFGGRTKASMPGLSMVPPDAANVPGPGQYDLPGTALTGPSFTLRGRPREKLQEELPGPGQYDGTVNTTSIGEGPAYTLGAKPPARIEDIPGPGDYNIPRAISTGPAVTMQGRPRPAPVDVRPGPADYQKLEQAGKDAPAFTLLGRIEPKAGPGSPAPGEYEIPEAWNTGAAYTIRGRPQERPPEDSPGPGDYFFAPGFDDSEGPAFTLGRRPKDPAPPDSPGPGEYYRPPRPSAPAFTLTGRPGPEPADKEAALVPGPGAYNTAGSPSAPAYTMGARPVEVPKPGPGPGSYDVRDPQEAPAFTFASRPTEGERPQSPGPGEYDGATRNDAGPAFTMGARIQEKPPDGPAPGEYNVPSDAWREGPSFSLRPKPTSPKAPDSPGPGQYGSKAPDRGPAFTIAGRTEIKDEREQLPGPGEYQTDAVDRGPAYSFAGKPGDKPRPDSPGPGEYHQARAPGSDGPAYTFQGAAAPDPESLSLGPGAYNPQDPRPGGPAYTLRPKVPAYEEQPGKDSPGPGAYPEPAPDRGVAYSFPGPARPGPEPGADSPGPSHYRPASPPSGPAYTFRPKPPDPKPPSVPGPGEYSSPGKSEAPAYTIRPRPKDPEPPRSPGPGEYHKPDPGNGPAYTMPGRPKDWLKEKVVLEEDMIPPPGSYGNPGQELIGSSGPAYTMRPRLEPLRPDDIPGPGNYAPPGSPNGPAYTLAPRLPSTQPKPKEGPGPGQYGSPGPATGTGGPAWTLLGKVAPPKKTNEEGPAPGDYAAVDPGPTGPAWTLTGKQKGSRKKEDEPGPGEHQHMFSGPNGVAWSFGKKLKKGGGRRRSSDKGAGPDPGQYFQPMGPGGPAHSFPGSPRGRPMGDPTPGPGEHDDYRDMHTSPAWTLAPKHPKPPPPDYPGPGTYNDLAASRSMGALVSSVLTHPQHRSEHTSFGYADLYGRHGPAPTLHKRVTFAGTTRFLDSLEQGQMGEILHARGGGRGETAASRQGGFTSQGRTADGRAASMGAEDVRRLAGGVAETMPEAGAAGRRRGPGRSVGSVGRVLAAATENAARALAAVRLDARAYTAAGGPAATAQQRRSAPRTAAAREGGVRYETRVGSGGAVFTFAVPDSAGGAAAGGGHGGGGERNLVAAYMGGPGRGSSAPGGSGVGAAAATSAPTVAGRAASFTAAARQGSTPGRRQPEAAGALRHKGGEGGGRAPTAAARPAAVGGAGPSAPRAGVAAAGASIGSQAARRSLQNFANR